MNADSLIFENPGSIRTGKKQMLRGGVSDPRNKTLMKMFGLLGIGERAGSGIPDIYKVWEDEGLVSPVVEETFNPDRTSLSLAFKKQAIKTSDKKQAIKTSDKKPTTKTDENKDKIRNFLKINDFSKTSDIASMLGLSPARTRTILSTMDDVETKGKNKMRVYYMK